MIADAVQNGVTEAVALERGFTPDLLAGLVRDGLAAATVDRVVVGGHTAKLVRLRITNTGTLALIRCAGAESVQGFLERVSGIVAGGSRKNSAVRLWRRSNTALNLLNSCASALGTLTISTRWGAI